MEKFFKEFPMIYQVVIELALLIIGAGIALPGQKRWGWIVFGLGIAGILMTMKMKGLFAL